MTREPGDLPGRRHPSGVRGARVWRSSAVVTEGNCRADRGDRHAYVFADFCEQRILSRARWDHRYFIAISFAFGAELVAIFVFLSHHSRTKLRFDLYDHPALRFPKIIISAQSLAGVGTKMRQHPRNRPAGVRRRNSEKIPAAS